MSSRWTRGRQLQLLVQSAWAGPIWSRVGTSSSWCSSAGLTVSLIVIRRALRPIILYQRSRLLLPPHVQRSLRFLLLRRTAAIAACPRARRMAQHMAVSHDSRVVAAVLPLAAALVAVGVGVPLGRTGRGAQHPSLLGEEQRGYVGGHGHPSPHSVGVRGVEGVPLQSRQRAEAVTPRWPGTRADRTSPNWQQMSTQFPLGRHLRGSSASRQQCQGQQQASGRAKHVRPSRWAGPQATANGGWAPSMHPAGPMLASSALASMAATSSNCMSSEVCTTSSTPTHLRSQGRRWR